MEIIRKLPLDIIQKILPYTYNIQSNLLLEDIKNYYKIKTILMDENYDTNMIKHITISVFYDNQPALNKILYRNFNFNMKKYDCNLIYNYSKDTIFNILLGLFTKEERNRFLDHLLEDNGMWIRK
jgi:hypothetical protein